MKGNERSRRGLKFSGKKLNMEMREYDTQNPSMKNYFESILSPTKIVAGSIVSPEKKIDCSKFNTLDSLAGNEPHKGRLVNFMRKCKVDINSTGFQKACLCMQKNNKLIIYNGSQNPLDNYIKQLP